MLSERHVNMMAFSQCIGIGLFLQSGRVIYLAGPGLGTIAYFLTGTVMWSSASCLGEMAALFPVKGPIFEFPRRFLDESLGYAAGWMTWYDPCYPTRSVCSNIFKVLLDSVDRSRAGRSNAYLSVRISYSTARGSRLP